VNESNSRGCWHCTHGLSVEPFRCRGRTEDHLLAKPSSMFTTKCVDLGFINDAHRQIVEVQHPTPVSARSERVATSASHHDVVSLASLGRTRCTEE